MKGKILIVDDDAELSAECCSGSLEDDYEVTEADKRRRAEKALAQAQPDVVLLDVKLATDANGLDLLPSIKKRWPETEVIVLTGAPEDDTEAVSWAVEATKRGAYNFLRGRSRAIRRPRSSWPMSTTPWSAASRARKPACCAARWKP